MYITNLFNLKHHLLTITTISLVWLLTTSNSSAETTGIHNPTHSVNVNNIIEQAIAHDPNVEHKWHAFLASGQSLRAGESGFRPSIDLFADYGIDWRDFGPNDTFSGGNINLKVTQMLYDGFRTKYNVSLLKNEQLVRYFELLDAAENTTLETYTAYNDILRYREMVRLAQDNLQTHLKIYGQIQEGANSGAIRRVDLEQAEGRLALAQTNLMTERSNLHDVSARFLRIVGMLPPHDLMPTEITLSEPIIPVKMPNALNLAYLGNPGFHASLRRVDASQTQITLQQSEYRPQVNLTGQYNARDYDSIGNQTSQNDARIALELNYNFYNGGRTQANVARAINELSVAESLHYKTCIDMRQSLQIAHNNIYTLIEKIPQLDKHRQSSNRVREAYQAQYEIGQRTLLDLLDGENEFFQASRAYTNGLFDFDIAKAQTLAGMGKLMIQLNVIRSGLPNLAQLDATPYNVKSKHQCPAPDDKESVTTIVQDSDGDGVADHLDQCPNTPQDIKVDQSGCTIYQAIKINQRIQINFARNSDLVDEKYYQDIQDLVTLLQRYPDSVVELQGHASLGRSAEYNIKLSKRRADAVAKILTDEFGINRERVTTVGYGFSQPLINANTPEADQINQRIEAIISGQSLDALRYE
jgi:adhesin transport system outer membrane protein